MEKADQVPVLLSREREENTWLGKFKRIVAWASVIFSSIIISLVTLDQFGVAPIAPRQFTIATGHEPSSKVSQSYNLTIGVRWLNLDGGRWRPMFVCNGQAPCPTLELEEGDELLLHVINDLGAQLSIHWSGMAHRRYGFWNDGTGGLNQYPILPRGNWTSKFDLTDHWGLSWYADHSGAGVADGVYGTIYVAPSPSRPRPYGAISDSAAEIASIMRAEKRIQHMTLWNSDFRTAGWKLDKLKATGALGGLYCYKSILVNGKGRVFCKNPSHSQIDGVELDDAGCLVQTGFDGEPCKPSLADLEVIETKGQAYLMLNIINVGFEHALKYSIDNHKMWVVATDAGFVEPQLVDVLYITNGARKTVLVKLDQQPADYAIRIASTSMLQNLESLAILRYPAKRYPMHGRPMEIPSTDEHTRICLNADSSVPKGCKELDPFSVQPHQAPSFPQSTDLTLRFGAGGQSTPGFPNVTQYYVNEKPWQLFRAAQEPIFFTADVTQVEKPIQADLPLGTVVDLIVHNTLNETIPMYKHGYPTWHLGSEAHSQFRWDSVAKALKDGAPLNVKNPSMDLVHDLPPLGWLAIRWRVSVRGATMFHAVKLKYFALGMAAPMLEGMEHSMKDEIPEYAKTQPHIVFEPANDGVFGK